MQHGIIRLCQVGLFSLIITSSNAFAVFDSSGATSAPPPNAVMSPSEFSSRVSTLKQQTKDSLAAEAKSLMTAKPINPMATPAAGDTSSVATTPSNTNPAASTTTAAPAQNQPYTGFGPGGTPSGGTTNPPSTPSTNTNSSGWNVKY